MHSWKKTVTTNSKVIIENCMIGDNLITFLQPNCLDDFVPYFAYRYIYIEYKERAYYCTISIETNNVLYSTHSRIYFNFSFFSCILLFSDLIAESFCYYYYLCEKVENFSILNLSYTFLQITTNYIYEEWSKAKPSTYNI